MRGCGAQFGARWNWDVTSLGGLAPSGRARLGMIQARLGSAGAWGTRPSPTPLPPTAEGLRCWVRNQGVGSPFHSLVRTLAALHREGASVRRKGVVIEFGVIAGISWDIVNYLGHSKSQCPGA